MKHKLFDKTYVSLFQGVGEPTLRSAAELRAMQKKCTGRNDPNTFYATVDPRPDVKVTWSYSTDAHFGPQKFTYQNFFDAIHPFWLPLYMGMVEFTLRLVKPTVNESGTRNLSLTTNLPLRNKSGKYYWYSQVSFAGSFDGRGALVEYFNEFHRLAEFDRMIPSRPSLTYRGNLVGAYDIQLREAVEGLLGKSLRQLFSPTCFKLLHAYRIMKSSRRSTSREAVSNYLGVRLQALDKRNVRLLAQARLAFPAAMLTSVADLANSINEIFGMPLDRSMSVGI